MERTETVNLNALFERMTEEELETYARDGKLPDSLEATVGRNNRNGAGTEDEQ